MVGDCDGIALGVIVGDRDGMRLGDVVGKYVGRQLGSAVGITDGLKLETIVGEIYGGSVGVLLLTDLIIRTKLFPVSPTYIFPVLSTAIPLGYEKAGEAVIPRLLTFPVAPSIIRTKLLYQSAT